MEHSHHEEPKKQSALFSYIAAGILITCFLIFINVMGNASRCCGKDKKCSTEQHGETHGEDHGGGEHHEGH